MGEQHSADLVEACGTQGFDLSALSVPADLAAQIDTGAVRLSWSEPPELDVRLYHLYASITGEPAASQAARIASMPAGHPSYLDWSHGAVGTIDYAVTAADYQGNESELARESVAP